MTRLLVVNAQEFLRDWMAVVLILPADMTELVGAGRQAAVLVDYDAARPESAGAELSLVQNLLAAANLALSGAPSLLVMEASSVQTESLRPIDTQMPGMLGIALMWLGLLGTALPLVQPRSSQVLARLSVTPLRPASMLSARVSWQVCVGLVQAGLPLLVGLFVFQVGVQGNILLFPGCCGAGVPRFVSLGYALEGLISSEEGVLGAIQLVSFPMMFLCGGLFAISSLPDFLQPVSKLRPLTYLTDALGRLMVGAPPLHPPWLNFFEHLLPNCTSAPRSGPQLGCHFRRKALIARIVELQLIAANHVKLALHGWPWLG